MSVLKQLRGLLHAAWGWPLALLGVQALLHALGPQATETLRYERATILGGEAWRLVTGHLVHADLAHLAWNALGIAIVWVLFAREFSRAAWIAILLVSTACIDAGFLLFEPQLRWYVGFSGVLHGAMAAGLVSWLRARPDPLGLAVGALFVGKLAWEHAFGALPFTAQTLSVPVVHAAHSYGAIGGALAAAWIARGTVRRPSL